MHASTTSSAILGQASNFFQAVGSTPGYVKILVQVHQWRSSNQLDYLYLDLYGETTSSTTGRMVLYGVNHLVLKVPSAVFDQVYIVADGPMELQTDLDLRGQTAEQQLRWAFFRCWGGGVITMHEDMNTNGFRLIGKNRGGGVEIDDYRRLKMHEDLDLNRHGIHDTFLYRSRQIALQTPLNLNGQLVTNRGASFFKFVNDALKFYQPVVWLRREYFRGSIIATTEIAFVFAGASYFQITYGHNVIAVHFFYADRSLSTFPRRNTKLNYEGENTTQISSRNVHSTSTGRYQSVLLMPLFANHRGLYHLRIKSVISEATIFATVKVEVETL